uniref:Uncharacterized protein n=1 Tax=Rhizophora mucronata TaxID=61149 RepID=A0A2P2P1Z2_RHIMU
MGRKPNAAKLAERPSMLDSTNLSAGGRKLEPKTHNQSSDRMNFPPGSKNPAVEKVEPQPETPAKLVKSSSRRKMAISSEGIRRSQRLSNAFIAPQNRDVERVIEEITVTESEKEDDAADKELEEINLNEKNTESKVDYLAKLLEAQQKTIDELKSKFNLELATKKAFFCENSGSGDISYKGLYIEAQKRVEALLEANNQLSKKLEHAFGKLEVYEKETVAGSQLLEKLKDLIVYSSLTKATQMAGNTSSEAIHGAFTTLEASLQHKTPTKRKRLGKKA